MTADAQTNCQVLADLMESEGIFDNGTRLVFPTDSRCEDKDDQEGFIILASHEDQDRIIELWNAGLDEDDHIRWIDDIEGFDGGFYDEYSECSHCYSLIQTSPDSYSWQPDFTCGEDGYTCKGCHQEDPEEYFEAVMNNPRAAVNDYIVDPTEHGWDLVDHRFEHGLYGGQTACPTLVSRALDHAGLDHMFKVEPGQFDCRFYVYVPEGCEGDALRAFKASDTDLDYDPAVEMSNALKGVASAYKVVKQEITPEQFIAGVPQTDGDITITTIKQ